MIIIGTTSPNGGGNAVAVSVHGLGLTGIERALFEFTGRKIEPRKFTRPEDIKIEGFSDWLAARGCEIGRSRDGAWLRIVDTKIAEATPAGSIKCRHRRDKYGFIICYGLPAEAYPFDKV